MPLEEESAASVGVTEQRLSSITSPQVYDDPSKRGLTGIKMVNGFRCHVTLSEFQVLGGKAGYPGSH